MQTRPVFSTRRFELVKTTRPKRLEAMTPYEGGFHWNVYGAPHRMGLRPEVLPWKTVSEKKPESQPFEELTSSTH